MAADARVSIYVPTRHRSSLLERAVRSALGQTYPQLEVIIGLDRPDEETRRAAKRLMAQGRPGRQVLLVESSGSGACAARNAAIAQASGPLATGLDDDDYMEAGHVAALAGGFDPAQHGFAFTGYRTLYRGAGGAVREASVSSRARFADAALLLRKNVVGNQVLTLTSRLRAIGGYDEELQAWQDHDLWLRLARRFGRGVNIPGNTYVSDQVSAADRISADPARIDTAMAGFCAKHAEYRDPTLLAFLRLGRARYGHNRLSLEDVLRIASAEGFSRLAAEAILVYARLIRAKA